MTYILMMAAILVALHAPFLAWLLFALAVVCAAALAVGKALVRGAAKRPPQSQ